MTKVDVAIDLKGAFMPDVKSVAYSPIKKTLEGAINQLFSSSQTNFLSNSPVSGLKVMRGDNNLDTCFQYIVEGEGGDKLLVVKFYDKLLDLIARDGTHLVGSRIATILGCKQQLTLFDKRIRKLQHAGMTRVEVSICRAALEKFNPF